MADEKLSSRTRKTQNHHDPLAKSNYDDILAAAWKLMQLSNEDKNNNNDDGGVSGKRKRVSFSGNEEMVDQRLPNNKTFFGNDVEVIARPKKMKKFRSLADIFMATTPTIQPAGKK